MPNGKSLIVENCMARSDYKKAIMDDYYHGI